LKISRFNVETQQDCGRQQSTYIAVKEVAFSVLKIENVNSLSRKRQRMDGEIVTLAFYI
jgi:hypothetical protein